VIGMLTYSVLTFLVATCICVGGMTKRHHIHMAGNNQSIKCCQCCLEYEPRYFQTFSFMYINEYWIHSSGILIITLESRFKMTRV